MVKQNELAPAYWIIILIASVVGIITIFMSWMDISIVGLDASYNAWDFATEDVFKDGGLLENFNAPGKYIPIAIGALSLIEVLLAIRSRNNAGAAMVVGLIIFVLAIYFYTFVDPVSNGSFFLDRQVGIAVWVSMAVGLVCMIAAAIQSSVTKSSN